MVELIAYIRTNQSQPIELFINIFYDYFWPLIERLVWALILEHHRIFTFLVI